ncbi:MAG: hypothetical protein V4702_01745 [Patescibacteria group bacterium]
MGKYEDRLKYLRSPESYTAEWEINLSARLNRLHQMGRFACRIDALDPIGLISSVVIVPNRTQRPKDVRRAEDGRLYLPWAVMHTKGTNPDLQQIDYAVINIAGIPTAKSREARQQQDGENRLFPDMLFRGGELEVTSLAEVADGLQAQSFNLGEVVGLVLIAAGRHKFPVWAPLE